MQAWNKTMRLTVGSVSLEIPAALAKREGTAVDSAAAAYEAPGLSVLVDQGPFADQLSSYVGRPDYRVEATEIAGAAARIVSFRTPEEKTYTVAVHVPHLNRATVVVRAADSVPEQVARAIIQSVKPLK